MPPEELTPYESGDGDDSSTGSSLGDSSSGGAAEKPVSPTEKERPLNLNRLERNRRSSLGRPTSGRPSQGPSGGGSGGDIERLDRANLAGGLEPLVRAGLRSLETQRTALQQEINQLERRKARLEKEMTSNFAGASQDIAIRVQGFKDYLIGSLQDLVTTAEQMELTPTSPQLEAAPQQPNRPPAAAPREISVNASANADEVSFAAQRFAEQRDRVRSLLDQYRTRPDYYGPPWQLRRTFEPVHAERTANWFFTQGGRGAVKSMGSRLQNVLVASAAISCLFAIYDRRLCVLVLATTPERLGEWRRWLQDSLGIARGDFGTNRGVMLFESPEPMAQRAERLMDTGRLPFLIMDEAETKVSLSLLQYPLWLGFAPDPANPPADYDYF